VVAQIFCIASAKTETNIEKRKKLILKFDQNEINNLVVEL